MFRPYKKTEKKKTSEKTWDEDFSRFCWCGVFLSLFYFIFLVHNSRVKSLRAFEPFSSFTSRRDDSCPIFPDSLQSPVRCFPCSLSIGLHLHLYILLQIHRHYFQLYKKRHWEALTFHFHCPMKCVCVTHFVYSATGWEGKDQWLNNSEIIKNKIQNSNKNWIKKELH